MISPCALFGGGLLSPYCVSGEWYTRSPRTVLTDFFISLVGSGHYHQRERRLRRVQARAKAAFKIIFANGSKIDLEHHLVYHTYKCSSFTLCLVRPYLFCHLSNYEPDQSFSARTTTQLRECNSTSCFLGRLLLTGGRANIVWRWVCH